MTAPMPTERQLTMHTAMYPDHKYRARLRRDGIAFCQTCATERGLKRAQSNIQRSDAPKTRIRDGEIRTEATPAGFVTHEGGTMRTQALAPGVGVTLGQLAAFIAMARDMAGLPDSARIDVTAEARRRGRAGARIRTITITPVTGAEEAEDVA